MIKSKQGKSLVDTSKIIISLIECMFKSNLCSIVKFCKSSYYFKGKAGKLFFTAALIASPLASNSSPIPELNQKLI